MRWQHVFSLAIIFAIALSARESYFWLDHYSATYIHDHIKEIRDYNLTDYSNAGQYLNFIIGIPLAISAALLGAFVTYQVGHLASTKDDFSSLKFVNKVSAPIFAAQSKIAQTLEVIGNNGIRFVDSVEAAIIKSQPIEQNEDIGKELEAIWEELEKKQSEHFQENRAALTSIEGLYERLESNMSSAMFLRKRADILNTASKMLGSRPHRSSLPNDYLVKLLPSKAAQFLAGMNAKTMVHRLVSFSETAGGSDTVRAYFYLPDKFNIIEFAGMVLFSPYFKLANPITLRNGYVITGYSVNVAGAYLATIYESLPDKRAMLLALEDVMPMRNIAAKYLKKAGPEISELAPQHINRAIKTILKEPNRLIILQSKDGAVFYDPTEHHDLRNWPLAQEEGQ